MGKRSRYIRRRGFFLKLAREAWVKKAMDIEVPVEEVPEWKTFKAQAVAHINTALRATDTVGRYKQTATSEPKNYGPFNRAVRRYLKRHPEGLDLRLHAEEKEEEAESHE